jgi:hypothetical protein
MAYVQEMTIEERAWVIYLSWLNAVLEEQEDAKGIWRSDISG